VVAHNAETIELKPELGLTLFECKQEHLPTLKSGEAKLSIVTANRDVIAITGLKTSFWTWHNHLGFRRRSPIQKYSTDGRPAVGRSIG